MSGQVVDFVTGLVLGFALYHVTMASLAQRIRARSGAIVPSEDVATAMRRGER